LEQKNESITVFEALSYCEYLINTFPKDEREKVQIFLTHQRQLGLTSPLAKFVQEKLQGTRISSQFVLEDPETLQNDCDASPSIPSSSATYLTEEAPSRNELYTISLDSPTKLGLKNRQREERAFLERHSKRETELAATVCGLGQSVRAIVDKVDTRLSIPPHPEKNPSEIDKQAYFLRKALKDDWDREGEESNVDLSLLEIEPFASQNLSSQGGSSPYPQTPSVSQVRKVKASVRSVGRTSAPNTPSTNLRSSQLSSSKGFGSMTVQRGFDSRKTPKLQPLTQSQSSQTQTQTQTQSRKNVTFSQLSPLSQNSRSSQRSPYPSTPHSQPLFSSQSSQPPSQLTSSQLKSTRLSTTPSQTLKIPSVSFSQSPPSSQSSQTQPQTQILFSQSQSSQPLFSQSQSSQLLFSQSQSSQPQPLSLGSPSLLPPASSSQIKRSATFDATSAIKKPKTSSSSQNLFQTPKRKTGF